MDETSKEAEAIFDWVKRPERRAKWEKRVAESRDYGERNFDCTFIVFSEMSVAQRHLEGMLAIALQKEGFAYSAAAVDRVAGWMIGSWWDLKSSAVKTTSN